MKSNKVGLIGLVIVLLMGISVTVYYVFINQCTADGASVCYNKDESFFVIEDGAHLSVQVENEALGVYLVETWNQLHPEYADAVVYQVSEPLTASQLNEGLPTDVVVTSQTDAAYFLDKFYNMGNSLDQVVGRRIPNQLQDMINHQGYYFTPNSISGWTFVYNATLMEELGYSLEDADDSGLPDVFESWEQIFAEAETLNKEIGVVFPLTFVDQQSFYPFLTGGRWELYFTKNDADPGFSSREFYNGLALIEDFSKITADAALVDPEAAEEPVADQNEDETESSTESSDPAIAAEDLPWQYEEALYSRRTLFTMIDRDVTLFDAYQANSSDEYVVAPFPKYNNHRLEAMSEVNGYVVSKDVAYPSAAAEVIRILRSGEGVSQYQSGDGKTAIYSASYLDELTITDQSALNAIRAYNYHDSPSVLALKENPSVLARTVYNEIDLMEPLRALYNGTMTREEAQEAIVEKAELWLESKKPAETENSDDNN